MIGDILIEDVNAEIEDPRLICQKCGERFKPVWPVQSRNHLCQKCISSLPRCSRCTIILAPEYGFMMDAIRYGNRLVCGWCYKELKSKEERRGSAD